MLMMAAATAAAMAALMVVMMVVIVAVTAFVVVVMIVVMAVATHMIVMNMHNKISLHFSFIILADGDDVKTFIFAWYPPTGLAEST